MIKQEKKIIIGGVITAALVSSGLTMSQMEEVVADNGNYKSQPEITIEKEVKTAEVVKAESDTKLSEEVKTQDEKQEYTNSEINNENNKVEHDYKPTIKPNYIKPENNSNNNSNNNAKPEIPQPPETPDVQPPSEEEIPDKPSVEPPTDDLQKPETPQPPVIPEIPDVQPPSEEGNISENNQSTTETISPVVPELDSDSI